MVAVPVAGSVGLAGSAGETVGEGVGVGLGRGVVELVGDGVGDTAFCRTTAGLTFVTVG